MAKLVKFFCISSFFLLNAVAVAAQGPTISPQIVNLGAVSTPTLATVVLTNSTSNPIVITRVEADCHCTKTTYSRRPIAAADSAKIEITYTPSTDEGVFYKAVKVYTTASREPMKFIVRGTNNL